ncbi:MFS transporter [Pectinatus sottacetonis]|uniref:MFS transporter n=1 Tax=Pectinatus sottacetonis TaxID=1002795 RepID=UPI001E429302|nr:MFS transporter [Pectinatus sottacetonis]
MQAEMSHREGERGQHIKTLIGAVLGYAADGLDVFLLSFVLIFIIKDFGLTTAQAGDLTLATTIGMWVGSYIFGYLADKYGRTKTLSASIILYAVGTGLIYFVNSYSVLLTLRFLIGLGIGGEFGIGMAMVTETWSAKMRARATSWVALGWQGGVLIAAIVPATIVPLFGWRAVFLVGLVPALIAVYVRMHLKEPLLWQKRNQRQKELEAKKEQNTLSAAEEKEYFHIAGMPLKKLFSSSRITVTTIGLTVMCLVQNFGYYAIFSWMPTILSQKYGYTLAKTSGWMIISIAGMIVGITLFGLLADKIGRKKTFALWYICGTIYCLIYFFLFTSQTSLMWGSFLLGFTVNGMMGGYGAVIAENYPSEARSTAENLIFGTGRGLAGFGPAIIGYLAAGASLMSAMSLVFIIYPIALVCMLLMIPETKGIDIE